MPHLLAIHASPRCDASVSRKLTSLFVNEWRAAHSGGSVTERDLVTTNLPFVDLPSIGGAFAPPEQHSQESAAAIKISDDLVAELQSGDHIVIGTPMYNFSIPAVRKAYVDHVVRVGKTVIDNVGQLTGKKATVILASGYLRQVLGFIGMSDLDIIRADSARAGIAGETAIEQFGDKIRLAAAAYRPVYQGHLA